MSDSSQPHGLYSPWNSPGQNTGVGSFPLLQGVFPTQGSNPGSPHWRQILYQLSHKGSPRILKWVAYPFSRGSSQPRDQTRVSHIAGGFFTSWATTRTVCNSFHFLSMPNFVFNRHHIYFLPLYFILECNWLTMLTSCNLGSCYYPSLYSKLKFASCLKHNSVILESFKHLKLFSNV